MIPEHVLRKMRAALLVAGAAGCSRTGSTQDAGARAGSEAGASDVDATAQVDLADAGSDAATDDAGIGDSGAADAAVVACPFHPEGHRVLGDGGVQQAVIDPGLSHIGLNSLNRDPCPGCGMGGPRPPDWNTPTSQPVGEVQIGDVGGVNEAQATLLRRVMFSQRGGIRACYRQGLTVNPLQAGRIVTTITWAANGEVKTVTTNSTGTALEASTLNCVARRIRNMSPVTELAGATATVKITFTVSSK